MDRKNLPIISVIIPTYNRDKSLLLALDSLLAQKYSAYEIIIVDQSDKEFPEKKKYLQKHHRRLRYFLLKTPSIPKAINLGINKAKGEIILLTDDDVIAHSNLLSFHAVNYQNPQIIGVQGRVVTPGQEIEKDFLGVGRVSPWGAVAGGFSSQIKQKVTNVIGCNVSFRKKELIKAGMVDVNYIGNALRWETDLAFRILEKNKEIIFEPKAMITHLRAETGGCRMDNRRQWFKDFFHNETYFSLKWIPFYWWPIFWLIRWFWLIRSKSFIVPIQGISQGIVSYWRYRNENRY